MVRFTDLKEHGSPFAAGGAEDQGSREGTPKGRNTLEFKELCSEIEDTVSAIAKNDEKGGDLYRKTLACCRDIFSLVRQGMPVSLEEGYGIIRSIVDMPVSKSILSKALHSEDESDFVIRHSANVAVYSVKMAAGLGLSREEQVEIGVAGLVHEVGKCKIPENVLYKNGQFNDEELRIVREAPNHGYEILKPLEEKYPYLAECCRQVYERVDGSGYPKGLKGDEIHRYAQIIGLVDLYEALTHARPHRRKYLHFAAVKEIISSGKAAFQKNHLKAFLTIFSIFPLHSYVRLNSHAIGKVIEIYPDQPMRPKLEIISDSQGRRVLKGQVMNLPEHPLLYVVDSISQEELRDVCSIGK